MLFDLEQEILELESLGLTDIEIFGYIEFFYPKEMGLNGVL